MGLLSGLSSQFSSFTQGVQDAAYTRMHPRELYATLHRYYMQNALYDDLQRLHQAMSSPDNDKNKILELRNPCHRVVEFHVSKIWPGMLPHALPIVTKNERITNPIEKLWSWSNWNQKKQLGIRWFALFGDLIIKVAEKESTVGSKSERRIFLQVIDPRHVSDLVISERGYITFIRIDVPTIEVNRDPKKVLNNVSETERFIWTEVWDKTRVRIWKHTRSIDTSIDQLGKPLERDEPHGLDFVPFVYAPFRDVGEPRGMGAFTHALSKIDEANRSATRLHSLLFRHNDVTWAMSSNMRGPDGRPIPAPVINGRPLTDTASNQASVVQMGGERMLLLPGLVDLKSLVPQVDYNSALSVLNAHLKELEQDLPELRYYRLTEVGTPSGVALKTMLSDASDRAYEARGNAEGALARAHMIALTMAQRAKIKGFEASSIGTYADGDFDHHFANRPIFEMSSSERAAAVKAWVDTGFPLEAAMRMEGMSQSQIDEYKAVRKEAQKESMEVAAEQAKVANQLDLDKQKQLLETKVAIETEAAAAAMIPPGKASST